MCLRASAGRPGRSNENSGHINASRRTARFRHRFTVLALALDVKPDGLTDLAHRLRLGSAGGDAARLVGKVDGLDSASKVAIESGGAAGRRVPWPRVRRPSRPVSAHAARTLRKAEVGAAGRRCPMRSNQESVQVGASAPLDPLAQQVLRPPLCDPCQRDRIFLVSTPVQHARHSHLAHRPASGAQLAFRVPVFSAPVSPSCSESSGIDRQRAFPCSYRTRGSTFQQREGVSRYRDQR